MFGRMPHVSLSTPLLALGVAGLLLSGCDKLTAALEEKAQDLAEDAAAAAGGAAAGATAAGQTEDEQISAKLGLYIQCTNRATSRMYDSWNRYNERAAEDGTPRKKNLVPFLYKIESELTPCEEAVAKGPGMEPSMPEIEAAMGTYLETAKAFAAHTVELDRYYEQENYKDDDWAKAKEIAPKFKASFDAWVPAEKKLSALVGEKKDVVEQNILKHIEEQYGQNIEWQSRSYILVAKTYIRCVTAEGASADACEDQFKALEAAEQSFRKYYDANKATADKVFWMSSFEGTVTDFYTASKKFMRDFREGKAKPDAVNKVVDEYNDVIDASNNLRFER